MNSAKRPLLYHLTILASAMVIIVVGALLRSRFNEDAVKKDLPVVDALQSEVQAVKAAFRKNDLESISGLIEDLAKKVGSSVVSVMPTDEISPSISTETYSDMVWSKSPASPVKPLPTFSGLLLDNNGNVLTSAHIQTFRQPLRILLESSQETTADLVAIDEISNTALVRLRPPFPAKGFAEILQEQPGTGKWLLRLGRARSGQLNVSLGLLSSNNTHEPDGVSFEMQVNGKPDHDGSPVFDLSGKVVGLSRFDPHSKIVSVVPMARAMGILASPKSDYPLAPQSWVGIEVQDLDANLSRYFAAEGGVLVTDVHSEGTAFNAGLRQLDVIIRMNDVGTNSAQQLVQALQLSPTGKRIALQVLRRGRRRKIEFEKAPPASEQQNLNENESLTSGLRLAEEPPSPEGIKVVEVFSGSTAEKLGLKAGDLIVGVNESKVRKPAELNSRQIVNSRSGLQLLQIKRGEQDFCVAVASGDRMP